MVDKLKQIVFGKPRDIKDPHVFHHVSLIAFLAWVGLGADGLSSSAYGPDEAFRALGTHTHLAPFLVLMTAVTIFVISIAYSNLIEHFPGGGGGYLVATKLLGNRVGVVSGCALLVDYVLTISVSIASSCDALWSFLPPAWVPYKLTAEFALLGLLMILNLRGVKESVTILAPIFMVFVLSHAFAILYAIGSHFTQLPQVFHGAALEFHGSISTLGFAPVAFILLRAYSMGGGTYTGIEAVSNGVTMLREPRVQTGKRTMFMMATSLAFTAGGILFGYMLTNSMPAEGKTMNAVLFENLFGTWKMGGWSFGTSFVILCLVSEAALLFVAAQAGFLDGPRVLANMALDSWTPHRFSQLSNRLVTNNGIYLMGLAAMGTLFYTHGNITMLVVMYSINVFLTFTLTELGMSRHWIKDRAKEPRWKSQLGIHGTGLVMCLSILGVTLYEKFAEGGWMTVLITSATIVLCFLIHRHYQNVSKGFKALDNILDAAPLADGPGQDGVPMNKSEPTAILTVQRFSGFGLHQILSIQRLMPGYIKNYIFISAAIIDSGNFKGVEEMSHMEAETKANLEKYVRWSRQQGLIADYRMAIGTEPVLTLETLCIEVNKEFPRSIVFTGKLIFREEKWYQRLLHNETATALQQRLQFDGLQTIVLPIQSHLAMKNREYLIAVGAVAVATALCFVMYPFFELTNLVMMYLLTTLVVATRGQRGPAALSAVLNVLAFDFCFVPPRFRLTVSDVQYVWTFVVMFVTAMVISHLTIRMREESQAVRAGEERSVWLMEKAKKAEIEAEGERMRSSLLSSVSHDLRTPLASIMGSASTLLERKAIQGEARELLETIEGEAERLSCLVRNLLETTRLESGVLKLNKSAYPLEEIVETTLEHFQKNLKGREVLVSIPEDLPTVPVDPVLLEQVFVNLIENGIRYSPLAKPIEVSAIKKGNEVEVTVADRGSGLQSGEPERVFEKFYHGEGSPGAGLGLAICRAIVNAHGGKIWAENRSGGGAAFHFALPLS